MSQTYLNQLAKAQTLVDGLRKHAEWAQEKGIDLNKVQNFQKELKEAEALNAKVEELRERAKTIAAEANSKLASIKEEYNSMKNVVKQNINMERWIEYGVLDKR